MRNRIFQESRARTCQEIWGISENLLQKKKTDRARQARIDELSMHQERNPTTVSQLVNQIQDLQNKVNSLSGARELYDPETASSSGATHVPSQPSTMPSPRTVPCRDSGLPHDTRNIVGSSGNFFERLPAREGRTSTLRIETWHSWKYTATGKWNETRTEEFVNTCTTLPKMRWIAESYWWGLFSRWYGWFYEISNLGIASGKNSWLHGNPKARKSTSRLTYVRNQQVVISQCTGSKKLR